MPSRLKNCSDVDHFHVISWHYEHPTSEYGFAKLKKKALQDRGEHACTMTCPKVYSPYGLCTYLTTDPTIRTIISAANLRSDRQLTMLRRLTDKTIREPSPEIEESRLAHKADSLRGQKYDFLTKIMKKANSTDLGDIMLYCGRTAK